MPTMNFPEVIARLEHSLGDVTISGSLSGISIVTHYEDADLAEIRRFAQDYLDQQDYPNTPIDIVDGTISQF